VLGNETNSSRLARHHDGVCFCACIRDAARQEFRKTVRLSLEGMMSCRPATLTLRAAPRNYFSLRIPAAP
jgi:hypothetical protein